MHRFVKSFLYNDFEHIKTERKITKTLIISNMINKLL